MDWPVFKSWEEEEKNIERYGEIWIVERGMIAEVSRV